MPPGDDNQSMKITNMTFSTLETAVLYVRAGLTLQQEGWSKKEAVAYVKTLTPQNVLRLALGSDFPIRDRGGSRPNAGRPKQERPE